MGDEIRMKENESQSSDKNGMDGLHTALENMMQRVYDLQKICNDILKTCYGERKIIFPIDIEKIAHDKGIEIAYKNLNQGGTEEIDLNIAQLKYEIDHDHNDKVVRKILVDNSQIEGVWWDDLGPYSNVQKYAIAYEIGKIIVKGEIDWKVSHMSKEEVRKRNMKSVPYSLPKLYARQENFEHEMCAIFLLLPLDLFFDEFYLYLKTRTISPVYMERWIKHLSEKTEIPNYQLINGYQYIKFCACQYYQDERDKIEEKDYWDLYQ